MPSFSSLLQIPTIRTILVANFFLAFHGYLGLYINSSYLKGLFADTTVSLVYIAAAVVSLFSFYLFSELLPLFGARRVMVGCILLQITALALLALAGLPGVILVAFAIYQTLVPLLMLSIDIFTETTMVSEDGTGTVRGMLLTVNNLALVTAPAIAGILVGIANHFDRVYLASLGILIPLLLIVALRLRHFHDSMYVRIAPLRMLRRLFGNPNIAHIAGAQLILRIFFSFMVVYLPVYLHSVVGFSWPTIGTMLSIALLPYLFVVLPAGRIADAWLGERELLALGFATTAITVALFALPLGSSVVLWTLILVLSRIGASLIEAMSESYFFKQVNGSDADLVALFRMLQPISYIIGPLLGMLTLLHYSYHALWYVLAGILALGLIHAYAIKDTK